jgi:cytochrome c-type biogenesis protein CcmE
MKKIFLKILIGIIVIGGGISYFMYQAIQSSSSYYFYIDEFAVSDIDIENVFRITGKVKPGSVERNLQKMDLKFILAGKKSVIPVHFGGTIPENFTDDIEVVVVGRMDKTGIFNARSIITRCESKYKAKVD